MDPEAQLEEYRDDPEFEAAVDNFSEELFDITAANGRLWSLLRSHSSTQALELALETRARFRQLKPDIERIQQWPDTQAAMRFTQHKLAREFAEAFAEFQRIQQRLAEHERRALTLQQQEAAQVKREIEHEANSRGAIELDDQALQAQAFEEQLRHDEICYQHGLVAEREQEIQGIEQGIQDLNDIFTNLSNVVSQQGTVLDNIEANINSVSDATRDGAGQLTKAARWQKRSVGRQLCFLLILIILGLVIVLSILIA